VFACLSNQYSGDYLVDYAFLDRQVQLIILIKQQQQQKWVLKIYTDRIHVTMVQAQDVGKLYPQIARFAAHN
jgi:hypothetical protein